MGAAGRVEGSLCSSGESSATAAGRRTAAALALREEAMAEECLRALQTATALRRGARAWRFRAGALEAEMSVRVARPAAGSAGSVRSATG